MQTRLTLKYRLYANRRNRALVQQIDLAGIIWNHLTALQRRYYRRFGGYIGKWRMMKHIAKLRNGCRSEWRKVGSQAVQSIVERHDAAYRRFFEYKSGKRTRKAGAPRFRKVKQYPSFTLKQAGWKYLGDNRIRIGAHIYKFALSRPLVGEMALCARCTIKTVTVKRDKAGRLFVCFSVVQELEVNETSTNRIGGFDFGLKTFLTDDAGRTYQSPQFLRTHLAEIARLNRALARKRQGSGNRRKAKRRLALAHARVADKRRDSHFKLAQRLLDEYDVLCFEDLNIDGMKRLWGRKVSDLGFAEFVSILASGAKLRGKTVIQIDRFLPSSQVCSGCGSRQPMSLEERVFACRACGAVLDRDHNAARNIRSWGVNSGVEGVRRLHAASLV
ncbi:MAG: transposase [Caldilineaceae bacterium]|nr:transposase [Caldilineaceae bacterium]